MKRLIRPLREYDPFLLGLLASAVIALVVVGTLLYGLLGLGKAAYVAEFQQTGEIANGNEVRVAGMRVGEVTGVGLEGDHVLVKFRVDHDVRLGPTTSASIKLATLLGTRYLELTPSGSGSLPGGRIPIAHTTVPYNLQDVLQKGTPLFDQIDANTLRKSLGATAATLRGQGPQIGAALDGMSRLSGVILKRKDQIAQLIGNLDTVTRQVDGRSDQIFDLMGQSNTLLASLLHRQETIKGLIGDAASVTERLHDLIKTNKPEIGPLLDNTNQLTSLLRSQDDAVDRALQLIAPAGRYLTNAAGTGPYIDVYLPYSLLPDNLLCLAHAISGCK